MNQPLGKQRTLIKEKLESYGITVDLLLIFGVLVFCNIHLLRGAGAPSLLFSPAAFFSGEWWRLLTHPFVHVTWYHLFLDAGAFFLLYTGLEDRRISRKISYVVACGACSLVTALFCSPLVRIQGLCGLSGIANGLMAVSGLEMMRTKENFWLGLMSFSLVVAKSIYEVIAGDVFFSFMHLGLCGTPVAACHAGGVLGAIAMFSVLGKTKIPREVFAIPRLSGKPQDNS